MFTQDQDKSKYSSLNSELILKTLIVLEHRISERFPDSGLYRVAIELNQLAVNITTLSHKLKRPLWGIRSFVILAITLLVTLFGWLIFLSFDLIPSGNSLGIVDIIQSIESGINELIFLALAVLFLSTLETKVKRNAALKSLHKLRSMAHIVDMHQLTKDPFYLLSHHVSTAASPERTMTPFELSRYLDYCSELLAIISKLAALHVQDLQDAQVMATVNDVENLTQGLSNKIWQKLMILE